MHFNRSSLLEHTPNTVYAWHEKPGAFFRLIPPWEDVEVIAPPKGIELGAEVVTKMKIGPIHVNWVGRHDVVEPGKIFCDEMIEGPFSKWRHRHIFENENGQCRLTDSIEYELPLGRVANYLGNSFAKEKLRRLFEYRHTILKNDLALQTRYKHQPKNILITGSTGLIGTALTPLLKNLGHNITHLARHPLPQSTDRCLIWNFRDPIKLREMIDSPIDAVIHLAGESIAEKRWNTDQKKKILESRKKSTQLLSEAICKLDTKPSSFLCGSASGFYQESATSIWTESSPPGNTFLSKVCQEWEDSCSPLRDQKIRTVNLRTGIVLSPKSGALKKMLFSFNKGVGAPLGSGNQFWSWISLDDMLGLIVHCLETESISGPINAVSPNPLTNREFSEILARVLNKPLMPAVPTTLLRMIAGEMADELLLASRRLNPKAALETGYEFFFPTLESALFHQLGIKPDRKTS